MEEINKVPENELVLYMIDIYYIFTFCFWRNILGTGDSYVYYSWDIKKNVKYLSEETWGISKDKEVLLPVASPCDCIQIQKDTAKNIIFFK